MRALASFILQGRSQAVAVVAGSAGFALVLPPLFVVSAAALTLVTLRHGAREGVLVSGLALALMGGVGAVSVVGPGLAVRLGLFLWLPVLFLAWVLRVQGRLGTCLEVVFALASLIVICAYTILGDPAGFWSSWLHELMQPILAGAPTEVDSKVIEENISTISHYLTGIAVGGSVLTLSLGLLLGRWWQDMLFNPGGFRAEFIGMRLRSWVGYVGLTVLALAMTQGGLLREISLNLMAPSFLMFAIAGFAVLHVVLAAPGGRSFLLTGIYVLLFFIPYVLLPVALVGVSDVWMDWRNRSRFPI